MNALDAKFSVNKVLGDLYKDGSTAYAGEVLSGTFSVEDRVWTTCNNDEVVDGAITGIEFADKLGREKSESFVILKVVWQVEIDLNIVQMIFKKTSTRS